MKMTPTDVARSNTFATGVVGLLGTTKSGKRSGEI
jgi:hypothetical protein